MLNSANRQRDTYRSTPFAHEDPGAAVDAAVAGFWRENTLASIWHEVTDGDERRLDQEAANYNPYTRLKELYDPETLAKISGEISSGEFEAVFSDAQLKGTVEDILYEKELEARAEQSPGGYFMGALFGGLLDPASYIPFAGVANRVTRLGKAGMIALNSSLSAGVSEVALQATQRERSWEETLMNVGISGVLGGGLGMFAGVAHPKHVLHPDNPQNPLRRENLSDAEIVRTLDGVVDEITQEDIVRVMEDIRVYSPAGAGAESALRHMPEIARSEPTTVVGKAVRGFGDWFNSRTIKGQLLRASVPAARYIGAMLTDPSGILLKQNLKGVATAAGADALKKWRMTEFQRMWNGMEAEIRKLSGDVKGKKVDPSDVFKLTERELYSAKDEELETALRTKYGDEGFQKIKAKSQDFAETIHQFNERQEEELIRFGLVRDEAKVQRLMAEVEELRATARTANAIGEFQGQLSKKDIKALRAERDRKVKELKIELEKPKALGRDYGHAQMWNREMVMTNPAAFKAFLMDVLVAQPDELWLAERGLTAEQFAQLPAEEAQKLRAEYVDDEHLWRIERLETELEAAETRAKEARLDMGELLRKLGLAKRDEAAINLSVARKKRDALHAQLDANRARQEALRKEIRAFTEAAEAARMAGADRTAREAAGERTQLEITRDQRAARVGAAQGEVDKAQAKLDIVLEDLATDPTTPVDLDGNPRIWDTRDSADALRNLEAAEKSAAGAPERLLDAEAKVRQDMDNVRVVTARQQGKAREAAVGLNALIREADELAAKSMELDAKLAELEALQDAVTRTKRDLADAVVAARKERNIAETSRSKVKRALKKARNTKSLAEIVDEVYESIAQRGQVPQAILDRVAQESDRTTGRVKARTLQLSREQRLAAQKAGFLRDDLTNILYAQADQVAAELAIREALDIRPGGRFESWGEVHDWVNGQYDDLIAETADQNVKNKLDAERQRTWLNIVEARDRLKGGNYHDDGTATGLINYGVNKMAQANLLRYGSGFLVSSQTDLATVALRHGSPAKLIARYGREVVKLMTKMAEEDPSHFVAFARATEIGAGAAAVAKRFGTENALHGQLYGYGIGVGTTRKVTAKIDQVAERLTQFGVKMGGLPIHNTFWKITAAVAMRDRLADQIARYSELDPLQIADLASFGIGKDEAERIGKFLTKYGRKDEDGVFDPGLENWEGQEGLSAARDFEMAILRDMNRAVNTPDVGDTPRLMSHLAGRFLFTFQTFAFTFQNQYAYPMAQRIALFKDRQAMASLAYLLASATAVMVAKDIQNGRDPSQRFTTEKLGETIYEVVDRSGLVGFMSPYVDSALKLTSGYTGFAGGQRYARNNWLGSMLGVNYAYMQDFQNVGSSLANPDLTAGEKVQKALALAPYKAQLQLLGRFLPQ